MYYSNLTPSNFNRDGFQFFNSDHFSCAGKNRKTASFPMESFEMDGKAPKKSADDDDFEDILFLKRIKK